jgi:D-sedoheptulose 7-phosphate isomerase
VAASFDQQLDELQASLDRLRGGALQDSLERAVNLLVGALAAARPVLVCGNGGSAADAQHIAGELVGKFLRERRALNVRALSTDTSVLTAWANDVDYETVFARQVEAYAVPGGVLWAISTSGNSKNVLRAADAARERHMAVLALTGEGGGALAAKADLVIAAPSRSTPRIQEMHVMLYHYLCERIEACI